MIAHWADDAIVSDFGTLYKSFAYVRFVHDRNFSQVGIAKLTQWLTKPNCKEHSRSNSEMRTHLLLCLKVAFTSQEQLHQGIVRTAGKFTDVTSWPHGQAYTPGTLSEESFHTRQAFASCTVLLTGNLLPKLDATVKSCGVLPQRLYLPRYRFLPACGTHSLQLWTVLLSLFPYHTTFAFVSTKLALSMLCVGNSLKEHYVLCLSAMGRSINQVGCRRWQHTWAVIVIRAVVEVEQSADFVNIRCCARHVNPDLSKCSLAHCLSCYMPQCVGTSI